MAALQRSQLNKLCSTPETLEKAESILRLANAKTRPGSGFVVKNTVAIPAVCAYIASEQLNTGEVSLQSAKAASCVSQAEFSNILKTVRAALGTEEVTAVAGATYATLGEKYRVKPGNLKDAIACMEDAEAALPNVALLRDRYGPHVVSCAVFYWVCQLIEEPVVQERSLRQAYSIDAKAFKSVVETLDKRCDNIADQIRGFFKSPAKDATRVEMLVVESTTPAGSPAKKRVNHRVPFPETPTKKRKIDLSSPTKPKTRASPTKHASGDATAAFHAALKSSPTKPPVAQSSQLPVAGPSTPRRPRHAKAVEDVQTPMQADSQPSPMRLQGQTLPTRSTVHRRFRPIFLEQQQWCARDPKVERMWAVAETLREKMVALHGHPFEELAVR